MDGRERPEREDVQKGYIPQDDGVRGGYQPETSESGPPPSGGGGGKEPQKSDDD